MPPEPSAPPWPDPNSRTQRWGARAMAVVAVVSLGFALFSGLRGNWGSMVGSLLSAIGMICFLLARRSALKQQLRPPPPDS